VQRPVVTLGQAWVSWLAEYIGDVQGSEARKPAGVAEAKTLWREATSSAAVTKSWFSLAELPYKRRWSIFFKEHATIALNKKRVLLYDLTISPTQTH
jgi:hypothetical protein